MLSSYKLSVLAIETGDKVQLILFIALVAISVVAGILKKVFEQYEAKRIEREQEMKKLRAGEMQKRQSTPQEPKQTYKSDFQLALETRRRRAQESREMRQAQRQQRRLAAQPQHRPPPPRPLRQPEPVQLEPIEVTHVELEVAQQQRRLKRRLSEPHPKIETREPVASITPENEEKLGRLKESKAPLAAELPQRIIELGLDSREQLKKAIIYHEIFSAPKALRSGSELWEIQ